MESAQSRYDRLCGENLSLDLTRGKPSERQLALSLPMLRVRDTLSRDGIDCRNYGALEGLPEARELFGAYLGAPASSTLVVGNSSLALMHDVFVQAILRQLPGGNLRSSWHGAAREPTFLCPVPGYDRHFAICQRYGIKMIPVPMNEDGPDMDLVEEYLAYDGSIVGMWCVPKYSNPSGCTYSREVCERIARMVSKPWFRVFWDLAYQEHHLTDIPDRLPDMLKLCREAGHEDRVFIFGSTSKITFAGAGIAAVASSKSNIEWLLQGLSVQTIGPDKLNQLRHIRFLRGLNGIIDHLAMHRWFLRPKFQTVDAILRNEFGDDSAVQWNKPRGGYFVDLRLMNGGAKRAVELAARAGVKLTPAGASFPYGDDPNDRHIRIAPSYPALDEVRKAMEVVAVSVRLAAK